MAELYELNLRDAAEGIRTKKFSSEELFNSCVARAETCEPDVRALVTLSADFGREQAREIDKRIAQGEDVGPLGGVPVVLKDLLCTRGVRTTASSAILGNWKPPYDATVWALLHKAGAVLVGKANMDEFAMGNTCAPVTFGQTYNPWDLTRVPGGSSGGSAAAVAAAYAPFSLGTDTGGSIRCPASYCGLQGIKPTYGMVSRYGVISYASSLDQVGPFARSMADLHLVMSVLGREDPMDASSFRSPEHKALDFTPRKMDMHGKRVALVKEFQDFTLDPAISDALKHTQKILTDAGAEIVEVSLPVVSRYAVSCYYAIAMSEAATNLERYDGIRCGYTIDENDAGMVGIKEMFEAVRSKGFGPEVKSRIIAGTCLTEPTRSDKYYVAATKVRTLIAQEFAKAFENTNFILQPVTPTLAPKCGWIEDELKGYEADLYTLPVNMAGLPGLSFFAGFAKPSDGPDGNPDEDAREIPVGLQLVGPRWSDPDLLNVGLVLEERLGFPWIARPDKNKGGR